MTPSLCATMARYNGWMNERLYDAAATLPAAQLFEDRGAFFGSLFDTLNHIAVADLLWLHRFAQHPALAALRPPMAGLPAPTSLRERVAASLPALRALRATLDETIGRLATLVTPAALADTLAYRTTAGEAQTKHLGLLLQHFFNHQTHHRGQATTLLSQAGVDVGVTDLNALIPNVDGPAAAAPAPVEIVAHRATWPAEFETLAAELRAVLGRDALRIDHIGSTAVPGLPAKDVIDVQVTVEQLDARVADVLRAAGFGASAPVLRHDHLPPGAAPHPQDWAKFLFVQRPGARRSHIHVRPAGRPNQRYALLVRDFLRADRNAAQAYGAFKQRLASAVAEADAYPEVKDPVADLLHGAAERWAQATGWAPD